MNFTILPGNILSLLETALWAALGGLLFRSLHLPLPWMLGPLVFIMLGKQVSRRPFTWPRTFQPLGLAVIGYSIGMTFTPAVLQQIIRQLPLMLLTTGLMVLFSIGIGLLTAKYAALHRFSGILGAIPGGLIQMVAISAEIKEANVTAVTLMQTIRLIAVIFLVPLMTMNPHLLHGQGAEPAPVVLTASNALPPAGWDDYVLYGIIIAAGCWGAKKFHMPIPFLLGAMLASAVAVLAGLPAPHLPEGFIYLAQLLVGVHMGLSLRPQFDRNFLKLILLTGASSLLLIAFSLLLGEGITWLFPVSLLTAFLCAAPGGIAEMGITALAVHANVSVISAYQLFRLFFILFIVSPALKWWFLKLSRQARAEAEPS